MSNINLSGKAPAGAIERVKLEDKSRHSATLKQAKVQETADFNNPNVKINKILIGFTVGKNEVSMWANPKVSKGSGTFSNSKLYDVFNTTKVLDDFAKKVGDADSISEEDLAEFINASLAGKDMEVEISNAKKGTEDEYSNVGDVIKLL